MPKPRSAPFLAAFGLYFPAEGRWLCTKLLLALYSLAVAAVLLSSALRLALGLQWHWREARASLLLVAARCFPILSSCLLFLLASSALLTSPVQEFAWRRCWGWLLTISLLAVAKVRRRTCLRSSAVSEARFQVALAVAVFDTYLMPRKLPLLAKLLLWPLEEGRVKGNALACAIGHGVEFGMAVTAETVVPLFILGVLTALETKVELTALKWLRDGIKLFTEGGGVAVAGKKPTDETGDGVSVWRIGGSPRTTQRTLHIRRGSRTLPLSFTGKSY